VAHIRRPRITAEAVHILSQRPTAEQLQALLAEYTSWLYLPDPGVVKILLGAVAANRMPGDPVWPLLVGPPASGKTEILDSLLGLPDMHPASILTEASLLSGTARRERASDATGGLLRRVGESGTLLLKDFTSILSMQRDTRAALLAALREIHDGAWTRHVGTDGGQTLSWRGRCAVIGACTPVLDQYHAVAAAMGERFVLVRMPDIDPHVQACHALQHIGIEAASRRALRDRVRAFFGGLHETMPDISDSAVRLSALASMAACCRSAVERDGYHREIELAPPSECPARLALALARLYAGMRMIGVGDAECWRLLARIARDCVPHVRRRMLDILTSKRPQTTTDIAQTAGYPTSTTRRALEDLTVHRMVERRAMGQGRADEWDLGGLYLRLQRAADGESQ
jgi:hypothetical protein